MRQTCSERGDLFLLTQNLLKKRRLPCLGKVGKTREGFRKKSSRQSTRAMIASLNSQHRSRLHNWMMTQSLKMIKLPRSKRYYSGPMKRKLDSTMQLKSSVPQTMRASCNTFRLRQGSRSPSSDLTTFSLSESTLNETSMGYSIFWPFPKKIRSHAKKNW